MAAQMILDSRARSLLVLLPALGIVMWIASELADGEFIVPLLTIMAFGAVVLFSVFVQTVRVEAAILNMLLVGYLVGNRGFAELTLAKPFYPGEVAMAIILVAMLIRYVLTRELPDLSGTLARLIVVFLALGAVRLAMDYQTYRMDALRDSAMVYYSLFFFLGRELVARYGARVMLERALRFSFIALVPVSLLARWFPEMFQLVIFSQKDDLLTTFSALGIFVLYTRPNIYRMRWLRAMLIIYYISYIAVGISRAPLLAMLVGSVLLLIAGRGRFYWYFVVAFLLGMTALSGLSVTFGSASTTDPQVVLEKFESMVDITGDSRFRSDYADLKAGNNEFRRTLWQSFIEDTNQVSPIFGRGFGYDFIASYQDKLRNGAEWVGLRSAHNYYPTLYGRMGIIGSLVFLAITWQVVVGGIRAALGVRAGWLPLEDLSFWCGAWAILAAAVVGVVLEGPMGAIVFWSFLGVGTRCVQAARAELRNTLEEKEAVAYEAFAPRERPRLGYGAT